jgi:hypothetical protein
MFPVPRVEPCLYTETSKAWEGGPHPPFKGGPHPSRAPTGVEHTVSVLDEEARFSQATRAWSRPRRPAPQAGFPNKRPSVDNMIPRSI